MSAIMYPIHKCFNRIIFDEGFLFNIGQKKNVKSKKCFEFRTRLPRLLQTGTKVFVYETSKQNGCQMIVGEFVVGNILTLDYRLGATAFLPYFCRNVMKNEEYAQKFEKSLSVKMPNYKKGTALNFALDDESMFEIEQTGEWPKFETINQKKYKETGDIIRLCDDWLMKQGFYNDFCESYYKYAYEILNPVRYTTPKKLEEFKKLDGTPVTKAPQSFVYVQET